MEYAVLILVLIVLAAISLAYHSSKARAYVERWASKEGYELESAEQNNFTSGPWKGQRSGLYYVFRVTVVDGGTRRSAWLRLGSSRFFGIKPLVVWDDESPPRPPVQHTSSGEADNS